MEPCTSTNIFYERTGGQSIPTRRSVRLCAEAGYRLLDMCFVDLITARTEFLTDGWRSQAEGFQALARELGVRYAQSHAPINDFLSPDGGDAWRYTLRAAEVSAMLDVRWMVAHPSTREENGVVSHDTMRENVDYFRRLSDCAGRFGVGIAIENMRGVTALGARRFAAEPSELIELCDSIDAQNVGICWDTVHAAMDGTDQRAALRAVGRRLKAVHISDLTGADNFHILPYMGVIDWDEVLGGLKEIGFSGPFSFEVQHYLLSMPEEAVPAALRLSYALGKHMAESVEP